MYRALMVLLAAASGAIAFSPSAPGSGLALRRIHAARQQRSARHRVVCQAGGGSAAIIDVESTAAEPFLTFLGVSEKVMHAQEPPSHTIVSVDVMWEVDIDAGMPCAGV